MVVNFKTREISRVAHAGACVYIYIYIYIYIERERERGVLTQTFMIDHQLQEQTLYSLTKSFLTKQITPSKNRTSKPPTITHSITVIFASTKTQISSLTCQIQCKLSLVSFCLISPAKTVSNATIHQNH